MCFIIDIEHTQRRLLVFASIMYATSMKIPNYVQIPRYVSYVKVILSL